MIDSQPIKIDSMNSTDLPPTSLILCSRNRPKLLAELVNSILEGDELPSEIIVIDDSDSENEYLTQLAPEPPTELRYIWNRAVGLSRANNTGVAKASHEILVFTQDDVLVTPTWFSTIVRTLMKLGPDTVVTGRILPGEAEVPNGFAPSTIADDTPKLYRGRIGADVLYVQNMAIFRTLVDVVGGFDPEIGPGTPYPTAEDNDFGYRLLEAGYKIYYDPTAITYHRAWRDDEEFFSTQWNYGRGQGAYYAKHLSLKDPYMLSRLARDVGYLTLRSLFRLIYQQKQAFGDMVYLSGLLSAVIRWLRTQPRQN